ncbi:MAG TPA: TfoX/Sxy family protein [Terriglobia bacterium]|nr:TfoX/Sxy family protein [Terriglobia bacterium]
MPARADTFKDFVLDQLEHMRDLRVRRMFGSHGLYCGETFFGIISKSRLYFKTDEKTRWAYLERESRSFRPHPELDLKAYYEVPLEILEDRDQLVQWAKAAAAVSKSAGRRKAKSGQKR